VAAEGSRCVSSAKGLLLAKELCVSRIRVLFERASPRRSEGKEVVKSLKDVRGGPMSIAAVVVLSDELWREGLEASLLRMMERMA
jgi:hypothetical protein